MNAETKTERLTRTDLELIIAALQQRITCFSESRRACRRADGSLRPPDGLIANYGACETLFTEQIDPAQALLHRVETLLTNLDQLDISDPRPSRLSSLTE